MSTVTEQPRSAPVANRKFIKRPDDSVMKKELGDLRKEIEKLDLSINELNKQIDGITIDSSSNSRKQELQQKLKELTGKQGSIKNERNQVMDQIKAIDTQVKRKVNEIQAQTSKNNFKNVKEIDSRINYLDSLVDSGDLKLAEERKIVKEMSGLRKLRKDFGSVEKQQESIDQDKTKIAELRKKLNSIQNKEVQSEFEKVKKELDEIRNSNQSTYDKKGALITKRNTIRKQKDAKYSSIKKLRSDFDDQFAKFKTLMAEEKKKRDEEFKSKQQEEEKLKKKQLAEKKLKEASKPAFEDEINSIHNLLKYFDPSYAKPQPKQLDSAGSFTTNSNAIRTVEMPEDVVVLKKEQESFFEGSKGKKSKGKKAAKSKTFTVEPDIIVALSDLTIPLPTKQEDVPSTITTLKETLSALESKQEEQTKQNIEKAKAKIAEVEAEEKSEVEANKEN